MTPEDIVRQIVTMHWGIKACLCWVCQAARENGIHANEEFLKWRDRLAYVDVKEDV